MDQFSLYALAVLAAYLVAGHCFTVMMFRQLQPAVKHYRHPLWAYYTTFVILYIRWTCGWLPILIWYYCKNR